MDDILSRITDRLKEKYEHVFINERLFFKLNGLYFSPDKISMFNVFVVEYANNFNEAQNYMLEDGTQFPLEWGEDKIFNEMIKEIETEAKESD
ncbi:MAG: hypothetical protein PUG36_07470 [Clostridiales bacterium]|nr:hypothetical protein [Clostridiales bacterium]